MKNLHIANGQSAAGTLKSFFKEAKTDKTNTVYCFNDFLSIGSLYKLDTKDGIEKRSQFLFDMMKKTSSEEYFPQEIQNDITSFHNYDFSNYNNVIVWQGENTHEELLKLLCCKLIKQSKLYKINVSSTEKIRGNALRAVGECSSENIEKLLFKSTKISLENYKQNNEEWDRIAQSKATLRIYESGKIKEVKESYFDKKIIERCTNEYTLLLRITGEVMGFSEQLITDTFIIYRILHLIATKKIQYLGDLKNIRTLFIKR